MAYVTVPKDLTKIKSKVMFNLTKRQLICFSAAVAIGLPLFFFRNVKLHLDISLSVFHFRAAFRYKGLGLSQQAFFANGYSFAVLAIYSIPLPKGGICCAFP